MNQTITLGQAPARVSGKRISASFISAFRASVSICKASVRLFNAVTFRQWASVATIALVALLIYSVRIADTEELSDLVGVAVSASVAFLALWAADSTSEKGGDA